MSINRERVWVDMDGNYIIYGNPLPMVGRFGLKEDLISDRYAILLDELRLDSVFLRLDVRFFDMKVLEGMPIGTIASVRDESVKRDVPVKAIPVSEAPLCVRVLTGTELGVVHEISEAARAVKRSEWFTGFCKKYIKPGLVDQRCLIPVPTIPRDGRHAAEIAYELITDFVYDDDDMALQTAAWIAWLFRNFSAEWGTENPFPDLEFPVTTSSNLKKISF